MNLGGEGQPNAPPAVESNPPAPYNTGGQNVGQPAQGGGPMIIAIDPNQQIQQPVPAAANYQAPLLNNQQQPIPQVVPASQPIKANNGYPGAASYNRQQQQQLQQQQRQQLIQPQQIVQSQQGAPVVVVPQYQAYPPPPRGPYPCKASCPNCHQVE